MMMLSKAFTIIHGDPIPSPQQLASKIQSCPSHSPLKSTLY